MNTSIFISPDNSSLDRSVLLDISSGYYGISIFSIEWKKMVGQKRWIYRNRKFRQADSRVKKERYLYGFDITLRAHTRILGIGARDMMNLV